MTTLIARSPFAGQKAKDLQICDDLQAWAPENVVDVGSPILTSSGTIRMVVVSDENNFERVKLTMLPIQWQAIALAKVFAWSVLENESLPMVTPYEETMAVLRSAAKKLITEQVNDPCFKGAGWPATAFKYLGQFLAGKTAAKVESEMAWFNDWKGLPRMPLLEGTKSVAGSSIANEPTMGTGKKRKLSIASGSGINHPNHPLMKFISQKNNETAAAVTKELDKYLTDNESLNVIIGEKDKGLADLMVENERMKSLIDAKEKEIEAMKTWCRRYVEFTQSNPVPVPNPAPAPEAAPQ